MSINDTPHRFVESRRRFLTRGAHAAGLAALATLGDVTPSNFVRGEDATANQPGLPGFPNLPTKAKRMISLFQSGARRNSICSTPSLAYRNCGEPICRIRSARGSV